MKFESSSALIWNNYSTAFINLFTRSHHIAPFSCGYFNFRK
jgi:hypothetical protein